MPGLTYREQKELESRTGMKITKEKGKSTKKKKNKPIRGIGRIPIAIEYLAKKN